MNKRLVSENPTDWSESDIDKRTSELEKVIFSLWPVPPGHKVSITNGRPAKTKREILVSHLLEAGFIKVGQVLYPKRGKHAGRNGVILEDGSIEVEGRLFESPSGAGRYVTGRSTAGWHFWLVNQESRQMLWDIRQQYIEALSEDVEVIDDEDEIDDNDGVDGETDD